MVAAGFSLSHRTSGSRSSWREHPLTLADEMAIFRTGSRFTTEAACQLLGWHLPTQPQSGQMDFSIGDLPAGGRLIVFASTKTRAIAGSPLLHFKLEGDGGYLALPAADLTIASQFVSYPDQERMCLMAWS